MNYQNGKRFKFQELDGDVLLAELDHQLGIYVWSLRPTVTNVSDIGAILGKSTFHRRIKGKDVVSAQELNVAIDKSDVVPQSENYSLVSLEENRNALQAFSDIAGFISPPLYIGMSEQLSTRIIQHRDKIRQAFSVHTEFADEKHFGAFLLKYGQDLKDTGLIGRELRPQDLQVRVFTVDPQQITRGEVEVIENGLITLFVPPGNKKYLN